MLAQMHSLRASLYLLQHYTEVLRRSINFRGSSVNIYPLKTLPVFFYGTVCVLHFQPKTTESSFHFYFYDCSSKINTRNIMLSCQKHILHKNRNGKTSVTGHHVANKCDCTTHKMPLYPIVVNAHVFSWLFFY